MIFKIFGFYGYVFVCYLFALLSFSIYRETKKIIHLVGFILFLLFGFEVLFVAEKFL